MKRNPLYRLLYCKNLAYLGPTIFEIPQPSLYTVIHIQYTFSGMFLILSFMIASALCFPFLFRNVSLNMKAESYNVIDQLCNMANSTRKLEGHSFFMSSQKSKLSFCSPDPSTNSENTNSEYRYIFF